MAQQEEIVLWIDQRWKNAIEKHLKDETLQEHLENVLDELCNRLPEREYERISRAIQSEAAAQRAEEEAARTYDTDIDEGAYERLRGKAIRDMKRTNGRISFKDALDFQKSV